MPALNHDGFQLNRPHDSYELRATSYELRATSYELRARCVAVAPEDDDGRQDVQRGVELRQEEGEESSYETTS
ncbi:hypothetical protein EYF80_054479 [Liparis tanakae]|uniref:Uncharacterized protein n=1 Tax=Liparis tanakae TaxID=230148 RepID=A0A4Z2F3U4_9TELE|nr:hypothetical protein EYF80_054479 [Liparis tanakae]